MPIAFPAGDSVLAVPAVAGLEAAGFGLGDAVAASGAGLAAAVVDGQEVADLGLEGGWDAFSQRRDRISQSRARSLIQLVDFLERQSAAPPRGQQLGRVED